MDDPSKPASTKARRRILSCSHCRRLKSRCEYDPHIGACRRCHKLRINCSLHNDPAFANRPEPRVDTPADSDSRLSHVEAALASLQDSVNTILRVLQPASVDGSSPAATTAVAAGGAAADGRRAMAAAAAVATALGASSASTATLSDGALSPMVRLHHAQQSDGISSPSAPIAVVRTFRPKMRRLYEKPSRDIITQQIVGEAVADRLIARFLQRLGPVIQAGAVADLTAAPSLRQASPLLHAVCCLQAQRFFRDAGDPATLSAGVHRQLYEEVRRMLGQVVLATPVPLEELYAMLIMCTFEAAPRPVFEYIESWHLSGICAQQALSTINFSEIVARLDEGRHDARDKRCLSLWNNICLVHLRFAVGTGKPATIPPSMLELGPAIMDHPLATKDDGMVLAEMELLRALGSTAVAVRPQLDAHGTCPELTAWEQKWDHLLKIERALPLRFVREFAYLVLAMRLVDKFRAKGQSGDHGTAATTTRMTTPQYGDLPSPQVFQATAHRHALAVARLFLATPTARVQELPKFHHICIAYCAIVLAECADHAPASVREAVFQVLADVCTHYRRFADELPAVMHAALARMRLDLDQHTALAGAGPGAAAAAGEPVAVLPTHLAVDSSSSNNNNNNNSNGEPPGVSSGLPCGSDGTNVMGTMLPAGPGEGMSLDYFQEGLGVPSFLMVDDFFGTWMMDAGL